MRLLRTLTLVTVVALVIAFAPPAAAKQDTFWLANNTDSFLGLGPDPEELDCKGSSMSQGWRNNGPGAQGTFPAGAGYEEWVRLATGCGFHGRLVYYWGNKPEGGARWALSASWDPSNELFVPSSLSCSINRVVGAPDFIPVMCAVDGLTGSMDMVPTASSPSGRDSGRRPAAHVRFTSSLAKVDVHGFASVIVTPWSIDKVTTVREKVTLRDPKTREVLGWGVSTATVGQPSTVKVRLAPSVASSARSRNGTVVVAVVSHADRTPGTGDRTRHLTLWAPR